MYTHSSYILLEIIWTSIEEFISLGRQFLIIIQSLHAMSSRNTGSNIKVIQKARPTLLLLHQNVNGIANPLSETALVGYVSITLSEQRIKHKHIQFKWQRKSQ